ncbi:tetratricopeptide repeat protein [Aquabacterium sp. A7-Y]|uniref:tetratricopeptide repeat protein n=1 Tax=Aquabacterium sp. A7-Y TaxID=1349605 RepID=UPI00223DD7F0|nr:tetratricopeptide repeat protein [Aquabacterium sp. A7-Y]MCW7537485.1 tetratricopeptide repeat protein [Aquabacterium sp. A7-Y]
MPRAAPLFRLLSVTAALAGVLTAWPAAIAAAEPGPVAPAAPASAASGPEAVSNSGLNAGLFYQLLIGEMELRAGNPGAAYEILLDGARKAGDERLFRRAVEIAVQGRAGEQALAAAQAWRTSVPRSVEAHRYAAQLLVGLNRSAEALDPLRALLANTPADERPATIVLLPRLFARAADVKNVAGVLEQALQPYATIPQTQAAVLVANGRMRLLAQEPERALELARQAQRVDPGSEAAALLALELLPTQPAAEPLLKAYLQAKPDSGPLRLAYVRSLVGLQRYGEAAAQLEQATRADPKLAPAWLSLGALRLELKQPREAELALRRYVELNSAAAAAVAAAKPAVPVSAPAGEDETGPDTESEEADATLVSPAEGLTQAYLLLAQAAEEQRDYRQAEGWLARIDSAQNPLTVQVRRAALLAKQGRVPEARALIQASPERSAEDGRSKLLAESHLMRDLKNWSEAYRVMVLANGRYPDDADLLYEQAMMAEKLQRPDEMERLLRRVIELKPEHFHAYNALGYTLADRNTRLQEARDLVQKALELAPNEPFIIDSLGWIEYRMGRREEALQHLQRAYNARPDAEIAAHLGEVLWVLGRQEEARKVWREGRDKDAANDVLKETLARLKVGL